MWGWFYCKISTITIIFALGVLNWKSGARQHLDKAPSISYIISLRTNRCRSYLTMEQRKQLQSFEYLLWHSSFWITDAEVREERLKRYNSHILADLFGLHLSVDARMPSLVVKQEMYLRQTMRNWFWAISNSSMILINIINKVNKLNRATKYEANLWFWLTDGIMPQISATLSGARKNLSWSFCRL